MFIIPHQGVCDPHPHVWNGKVWLFTSHDRGQGNPIYRDDDWRLFSSDDLVNWKLEYTLHPEDTYLGKDEECYATDGAYRNGKYYFYFSDQQRSTGVAVSETGPAGPYKDALGKPLLPPWFVDTASYDPTVFIDDDENKTPYIIWGYTVIGKDYYIARLNDDMISLAEEPRKLDIGKAWANDATWMTKHDGVYYLNSHGGVYATSDNIYGPYTYRGCFAHDAFTDHGTFFTYHNQTYLCYAVPEDYRSMSEPMDRFYRSAKIIYAHYKDNGDVVTDDCMYDYGVGQYDTAWGDIRAEWFFAASDGIEKRENVVNGASGFGLQAIGNNAYAAFPKVRNMNQNAEITFIVSNGTTVPCEIEIRAGSPFDHVLGAVKVNPTGAWDAYTEVTTKLENPCGQNDLCFVFRSEAEGEALRFDAFRVRR